MKLVDLLWLRQTNEELKQQGITDAEIKISKASQKWRDENVPEILKDTEVDHQIVFEYLEKQDKKIEEYFLTQNLKNRGWIEPPYNGLFYFEGDFWEITIPLVFGTARIDFFECLKMPNNLKRILFEDKEKLNEFISVSCDCLDYGLEIIGIENMLRNDYSKQLFGSGDRHLRSTISLLFQNKTSSKALDDARMVVEIFAKAFLSEKISGFSDNEAKKLVGHNLEKGIEPVCNFFIKQFSVISSGLHKF